jgi:hypothetical protein
MPIYHHVVPPHQAGPGLRHGIANGCPFCMARQDLEPSVGKSILFLSGIDVGQVGVVVENVDAVRSIGRFLVKLPYGDDRASTMVDPVLDLFIERALMHVPTWMPPLSIEDACALHEMVLEVRRSPPEAKNGKTAAKMADGLIARCWGDRLPVNGAEVWAVLGAHGAQPKLEERFVELFDFGIALLVGIKGRPPVRQRRMAPLSRGRYLTKRAREKRMQLFGHD